MPSTLAPAATLQAWQSPVSPAPQGESQHTPSTHAPLAQVSAAFNVVSMDAAAFREWARLMHRASDTLYEDAMIAATARVHQLTVVTRNVADFKHFGVPVLNPFLTAQK